MTTDETCTQCGTDHFPEPCPVEGIAGRAAPPASFTLPAGAQVGEYRVTGPLGKGGMGVVYSGVHPLLGRKVAIKVLIHQASHSDEASARFLQEARAASTLRHPNIVDVFAFGQLPDGRYYQVMELLEGESLRAILDRCGPLSPRQARGIIAGVLSGLSAAHRRGVVHRDIKPDNIFICGPTDDDPAAGDIKILDFGVAKHESGERPSVKTRTGAALGTPAYMSPEQCRGISSVDGRTDLYATGVMLFEMLVGHTPYQSESAFDVMAMQINARLPSVAALIGRPEALEPVINRALEKRPEERYGTASEMLAAITASTSPPEASAADATPATGASGRSRMARDFADRETVPAVAAQSQSGGAGDAGEGPRPAGDASVRSGSRAVTPTFTGGAWRARALPYLGAGATLGLLIVGGSLLLVRARRPADARAPMPAAPAPAVASTTPAAPAPDAPSVPPAPAADLVAPSASASASASPSPSPSPPSSSPRPRERSKAGPGPRAKRTTASGARRDRGLGDVDIDSPLNPYAR